MKEGEGVGEGGRSSGGEKAKEAVEEKRGGGARWRRRGGQYGCDGGVGDTEMTSAMVSGGWKRKRYTSIPFF